MLNSCNLGTVTGTSTVGGIAGTVSSSVSIDNVFSLKQVTGTTYVGAAFGALSQNELGNIYYNSTLKISEVGQYRMAQPESDLTIAKEESVMKSNSFVTILNGNIGSNSDWVQWKLDTTQGCPIPDFSVVPPSSN